MNSDEFDWVEFHEKEKRSYEIHIEMLDYEIEEILPSTNMSDSWEQNLREKRETLKKKLERVESKLEKKRAKVSSGEDDAK